MPTIRPHEDVIDRAMYAVTIATRNQCWTPVGQPSQNDVGEALNAAREALLSAHAAYNGAAADLDLKSPIAQEYHWKSLAMLEAMSIVTDLYIRSLREYSEANEYARSAFC